MLKHTFQVALFDANNYSSKIEQMLIETGGEITPEIEQVLALQEWSEAQLQAETDLLAMSLERISQLSSYYKDQIEHLEKLVKGLERAEIRLTTEIQGTMEKLNLDAVEGQYKRLSLRRTTPKVEILDEQAVADEFKEMKITETIKKRAIADALKSGQELHWARLVSNKSLQIQIAKPNKLKESENEIK